MAYATVGDLWEFVEDAPSNADMLLAKASRKLDAFLIGSRYPVDVDGMPTEVAHIEALRVACCQQVEWWIDSGDLTGSGTAAGWGDVKIGDVSLSRTSGGSGSAGSSAVAPTIAPDAVDTLRVAGMLPVHPYVFG